MTIINLIDVAIGCEAQDDSCKDGPYALLEAGALGRLQTRDTHAALVHDIKLAIPARRGRSARLAALPGVAGFLRALGNAIMHSVHQGHVPVIIGGDHSCAIGTWPSVTDASRPGGPLGLIWINAHLDSHTPQTSDSDAIRDTPLTALLGHGAAALAQVRDAAPKLLSEHVMAIDAHSYELAERALLDLLGVHVIGAAKVARNGLRAVVADAIRQIKLDTATFGVTLDLDAFNPAVALSVGTPETNGLTARDTA